MISAANKPALAILSDDKWRYATDDGGFQWQMKVFPHQPVALAVTYWGGDGGGREFDILVDGEKIATQTLANNRPGIFFDVTYPLPEKLTQGKTDATVRVQAHAGALAGGIFGARILRTER